MQLSFDRDVFVRFGSGMNDGYIRHHIISEVICEFEVDIGFFAIGARYARLNGDSDASFDSSAFENREYIVVTTIDCFASSTSATLTMRRSECGTTFFFFF